MNARSGASLAACQRAAIAPTPVAVAIQIVCDAVRTLNELHGSISPATVFVRYDGAIGLLDASAAGADDDANAGYLAPEQVTGAEVDRRADVFAFGVILWELLTGTRLFARATATETRIAIAEDPPLDVRDVNPEVPAAIGDVVRTALERAPAARFGTTTAFCNALASARAESSIAEAGAAEIASWVAQCVPPLGSHPAANVASAPARIEAPVLAQAAVPDLDVRGAPRTRSQAQMEAVKVPAPTPSPIAVPTLDLPVQPVRRVSQSSPSMSGPPPSSGQSSAKLASAAAAAPAHDAGAGRTLSFDTDDDDDFDMQIERNVAGTSLPVAESSRGRAGSGLHESRGRVAGTGLELGVASRMTRERAGSDERDLPGLGGKIAGYAVALVVMGGVGFALFHFVHRAGGRDVTGFAPHAFDGSSAPESGAVALVAIVVAVAIGFIGLRLKPHAWALVASGGAMLLLALAMVTVTLASTGENPTPPDGVLLVPYLLPAAVLLLGLGIGGRAARSFADGRTSRRLASVPLAAIAGIVLFFAFEFSRFAR
jgi:hypothetical protein